MMLRTLNAQTRELEKTIAPNAAEILEGRLCRT